MKLVPRKNELDLFGSSVFDDFWNDAFFRSDQVGNFMKTDITEKDGNYEFVMDLPGVEKKDIKIHYEDGYLKVAVTHDEEKEEKDKTGKVIRQERYRGSSARSFYIGKQLNEDKIAADYKDGVLKITVPTEEVKKAEEKKYVAVK